MMVPPATSCPSEGPSSVSASLANELHLGSAQSLFPEEKGQKLFALSRGTYSNGVRAAGGKRIESHQGPFSPWSLLVASCLPLSHCR